MSNFPGLMNFLVFFLAFGLPLIGWVFGKVKEQREAKQLRDEMKRRREEQLRTGRTGDVEQAAPASRPSRISGRVDAADESGGVSAERQRLQDLAAKRQAQLRELRARQRAQQQGAGQGEGEGRADGAVVRGRVPGSVGGAGGGSGSGGAVRVPSGGGPVIVPGREGQSAGGQSGGAQARGSASAGGQVTRKRAAAAEAAARAAAQTEQQAAIQQALESAKRAREAQLRRVRVDPEPARDELGESVSISSDVRELLGGDESESKAKRAARLRALIATREVLDSPVSLRSAGQ